MQKALNLFQWITEEDELCAVILVNDTDEGEARVEHAEYDEDAEKWRTKGNMGSLRQITDYSIPHSFFDDSN